MINWYKKVVFENYANFNGRARRSEFWYFTLCNIIISLIFYIPMVFSIILTASNNEDISILFFLFYGIFLIYQLGIFLPNLAVFIRRLHDINKSGWNILVYFIPIAGPIMIIIWLCRDSDIHSNKWGPNPKASYSEIEEIGL
jgi:uncharacterized membrane protein YhaH (DUF805 family)